jgi:hypothetical protein
VTTSSYGNLSADTLGVVTFPLTFAGNITSYGAVSSLQGLRYDIPASALINVTTFICQYYTNGLDFCVLSRSLSRISTLQVRYLILDDRFTKIVHFYAAARYYVQNAGTNIYNTANPVVNLFGLPAINTVGATRVFVLLNGFNATANSPTNSFDFKLVPQYPSSTTLRVTTSSANSETIQISSLCYCIIGYNENDMQVWPFPAARITIGTFNLGSPFADANSVFETYNTFWGMNWLTITGLNTLAWDSQLTVHTNIAGSTSATGSLFTWTGLAFEFKECNATTPYYLQSQDLCYDICPNRYYENNTQMLCLTCANYDCLKCLANGTCTSCDSTNDHRDLSAGRCVPQTGYYDNGVAVALSCTSSCLTCVNASTTCTSCHSGFYLSSSACQPCIANCAACTNGTGCGTCSAGYTPDGSGVCVGNFNCSVISHCFNCSIADGCLDCDPGFNLTSPALCDPICGDSLVLGG